MKFTLLTIATSISLVLNAQTLPTAVSFKTPEVSAINRIIETPVSYYTGVPNISIPLYEIKIKEVSVPITIDYHAGGIKVDQEATWVGLGWNLNYGGQVSRMVRGMPDECFYFNAYKSIDNFKSLPNISQDPYLRRRDDYITEAKKGFNDFMPDEFYYNVFGFSGRFMRNQKNSNFVFFPKEDIAVNYNYSNVLATGSSNNYYPIRSWNMKLPNGVAVSFGEDGISDESLNSVSNYTRNAWMIKQIKNNYNDSIAFYYDQFSYASNRLSNEVYSSTNKSLSTSISMDNYADSRIKRIEFSEGFIDFIYQEREDMPTKALSEIQVKDNQGKMVRKVSFYYSYFFGNHNNAPVLNYVNDSYKYKRLRLDSVAISNNSAPLIYRFNYYNLQTMPSKFSYAQDYWGFYNGVNNSTLVPLVSPTTQLYGAEKKPVFEYSKAFSISGITYPEGGRTEFIYEGNTASAENISASFLQSTGSPVLLSKTASISVYGENRTNFSLSPDFIDPYGGTYFKKQFTIPSNGVAVVGNGWVCNTNYGGTSLDKALDCYLNNVEFKMEKINEDGSRKLVKDYRARNCDNNVFTGSNTGALSIEPGNYEMTLILTYRTPAGNPSNMNQGHLTSFQVNWMEYSSQPSQKYINVGGIRIKAIKNYTSDGILATQKSYSYNNPVTGISSGRIISIPKYYQETINNNGSDASGASNITHDLKFFSGSRIPMETTSGAYLGYEYVAEEQVGKTPGDTLKTQYYYSFKSPSYDQNYKDNEHGIIEAQEWKRGKLLSTQYLKNNKPIREELFRYNDTSPHLLSDTDEDYVDEINTDFISFQSLVLNNTLPEDFYDVNILDANNNRIDITFYYGVDDFLRYTPSSQYLVHLPYFRRYTGFDKVSSKITIVHDDNGSVLKDTLNYFYDRTPLYNQLTRTQSRNSKQETITEQLKYPFDYKNINPYSLMIQNHRISPVIEDAEFKNSSFIKSTKTTFKNWGDKIIAPDTVEEKILNYDPETKIIYNAYDEKGNLLSFNKNQDITTSYIWGYDKNYPIANAINANASSIFHTSFEDSDGNSSEGDSKTGRKSKTDGYHKSLTNPKDGEYTLSYWQKSGFGWILSTNDVVVSGGSYMINVTGQVDELRLYPKDAQMTTYTYDPLIGMTSQTDANNRTIYYEYDGLGRLKLVRDQDNKIVKKICYNYAGQPENCGN